MWVLRRTDQGGGYVAKEGSKASYTNRIEHAKKYSSKEQAERDSCPGNEVAEDVWEIVIGEA